MKPELRQRQIAVVIGQEGHLSVEALAARFGVSLETIRRDLSALVDSGVVQKVHGGARKSRLHAEGSFEERMVEDAAAKRAIAQCLATLIEPGATLFIDTGSTTLACAEALRAVTGLTVITNSLRVAQVLGQGGDAQVLLLGGRFAAANTQTVGAIAVAQIADFRADHAILTPAAIDGDAGILDQDLEEALVARAMVAHARSTIMVAAAAKFGRHAAHRVCALGAVDMIVTDQPVSAGMADQLRGAGVSVRVA